MQGVFSPCGSEINKLVATLPSVVFFSGDTVTPVAKVTGASNPPAAPLKQYEPGMDEGDDEGSAPPPPPPSVRINICLGPAWVEGF